MRPAIHLKVMETISDTALDIRLFGPLEVRVHGKLISNAGARKAMWLLALLALRSGREVDRKWLATLLWPDSADELALYNLRRYLTLLRDLLGPESGRLRSPTPRTLALEIEGTFVDALRFDEALQRKDPEAALELYRGPLLEQCLEEWALAERDARERVFGEALREAALRRADSGDHGRAANLFRHLLHVEPMSEPAIQGLLTTLRALGDYAGAVQAYRAFRLRLREEINAEPAGETMAIYQAIRAAAGAKHEMPQSGHAASNPRIWRLPAPHAPIIGREDEIAQVQQALVCARMITLTGPGGVGKTRLAVAVAERCAEHFDSAWFADLSAVNDEEAAVRAISDTMDIPESPSQNVTTSIARRIGGGSALLILDNCERLVEPCAQLAAILLRDCPRLHILTTSRQPLGVRAEAVWSVPPLTLPDVSRLDSGAGNLRERIAGSEAVQLFLQRASSARRGFTLEERNARAVAELCCRLDGMPLAIELAAARARTLTTEQIVERLDRLFEFLPSGDRSAAQRQQTLRASMDWSYDLLTPDEQLVLQQLSVFAGGFELEAAVQVCATDERALEVEEAVFQLVDKSLVSFHPQDGSSRYSLLEVVRQYAREKLVAGGGLAAARSRHLAFFRHTAEMMEPRLHGPNQRAAMTRLDAEIDNLRAALSWSIENGAEAENGLALAGALGRYWANRGHFTEGWEFVQPLLAKTEALRTVSRVRALAAAGMMRVRLGDFEGSRRFHEASLALARELDDISGIWSALMRLGQAAYAMTDFDSARRCHAEALAVATEANDRYGMAAVHDLYGIVLRHSGEHEEAELHFKDSLALFREIGNDRGIADALYGLGMVAGQQGDHGRARDLLTESLAMHLETGVKIGIYLALSGLAGAAAATGEHTLGAEILGCADALRQEISLTPPAPSERENERTRHSIRSVLDEGEYLRAFERGRNTPLDEYVR